ncbi:hypothetical protein HZC09_06225 [Candidatus Micrarchaeota archaeon]|nr:hypothetical protein [Candidatus Micrarchaeota archaeon]
MLRLHFMLEPHTGAKGMHSLWKKLHELREKGIQPMFVAVESSNALRLKQKEDAEKFAQIALELKSKNQLFTPHQPSPEEAEAVATQAAKVVETHFTGDQKSKEHWAGTVAVCASYGVPMIMAEPKAMRFAQRVQRTSQKSLQTIMETVRQPTEEQADKKWVEEFYLKTSANIRRHKAVARELARCATHLPEEDDHIVVQFGPAHQGMEQHIIDYLKRRGINATIESISTTPHGSAIEKLESKRYANPRFRPSPEEIKGARKASRSA